VYHSPDDADSDTVSTSKHTNPIASLFIFAVTANNSPCIWDIRFVSPSPSVTSFSTMRWRSGTLNGGTRSRSEFNSSLMGPPALDISIQREWICNALNDEW
jgi:hypothetical protein